MNIFLLLAIFVANAIAITLIYQFVKRLEKMDAIIFIASSVAIIYIGVSIIYWISGFGIDSRINEAAKNFITFLFVPINVIVLVPFVAGKYAKYKTNKISKREYVERLIKVIVVGVIILIVECIYFKHMKTNIKILNTNIEQSVQENNKQATNVIESDNTNIISNEMTNEIIDDTIEKTENNQAIITFSQNANTTVDNRVTTKTTSAN